MGTRGRRSASELAIIPFQPKPEVRHPEPPKGLTSDQAQIWRTVVASLPTDWITPSNSPLFEAYCRHTAASRRIADMIAIEEQSAAFNLADYGRLLTMQERETRALSALATKLRLARSSVDDRRRAPTPPGGPRPW